MKIKTKLRGGPRAGCGGGTVPGPQPFPMPVEVM